MITIIGQGVPGLIFSHLCHIKQWDHQIIAPTPKNIPHKQILLNQRSIDFLATLGISLPIQTTYSSLKITQSNSFGHIHIRALDYHQDVLCYSISMPELISALKPKSPVIEEHVITGRQNSHGFKITTDKRTYDTQYVIGCDGEKSITQFVCQIPSEYRDPYHICVIPSHVEATSLIQRYSKEYILAVLPGTNGTLIVSSKKAIPPINIKMLQDLFGHNCEINTIQKPRYFRLTPKLAKSCYKHNALLLGNAALTIEPISAQGLNHTIAQIQKFSTLTTWSPEQIAPIAQDVQQANQQLYQQMHLLTHTQSMSRLTRHLLFKVQHLTPIIHDQIWAFGNRYDS